MFYDFPTIWVASTAIIVFLVLAYHGLPLWLWVASAAALLWGYDAPVWLWATWGVLSALFLIVPLRRNTISRVVMNLMGSLGFIPSISDTERTAIEAGTVWMDGELFSGKPNFKRILNEAYPDLNAEEKAFLDGPVEKVCKMTNDWDVFNNRDLPEDVWAYLKKERFFGLIIPKEYGGLGFSALGNSAVVEKLSSRSSPLGTTVMVPNSLGPAELLIHYGTDEQKNYYLPRLATGVEIPCFALTEKSAGSDAGAIESSGVIFRGEDGMLYVKYNWRKRYITLAAISTVLGLAVKLRDPENLLGKGEELGITCALIPTKTKGVELGRRHDPLGVPFYNCPTEGHDVILPVESIIGGIEGAGIGWRMLMESLAAGRGITLPASSSAGIKASLRVASAHAAVRRQFGVSIGKFGGIEEPLARLAGYAYMFEAARKYTCGALDSGAKPAVITAIAKYNFTETMRKCVNDAMDILGGAGISRGPRNMIAHGYMGVPVAITVEGANILTRTLMIFGQGAIRCHPYAFLEIDALARGDLKQFDNAFWKHIGHVVRNTFRCLVMYLTRGTLSVIPVSGPARRYFKKMDWASAKFALLADLAMGSLGGSLKFREKLTGRFADILSWMYIGTAVLVRFEKEGRRKEDIPFMRWSMDHAFHQMQVAFEGLFRELKLPVLGVLYNAPAMFFARINPLGLAPSDRLGHKIAQAVQVPGDQRDRLTNGIYIPTEEDEAVSRLENAFLLSWKSEEIHTLMRKAVKAGKLKKAKGIALVSAALEAGVITNEQASLMERADAARKDAMEVDDFSLEEYKNYYREPAEMVS